MRQFCLYKVKILLNYKHKLFWALSRSRDPADAGKFWYCLLFVICNLCIVILSIFVDNCYAGYSRIVSLAPSITNSLYDLECQDKIVGVTLYCKAPGKEIIGTLVEPSIEKIISLKPDLVIAADEWASAAIIDRLKNLRINVIVFKKPQRFQDICDNFIGLAKLV